jgi:translocation and assembly module TamB
MAEAVLAADEAAPAPKPRRGARDWLIAIGKAVVGLLIVLLVLAGALVAFLDTEPGHRLIVDRIAAMTPRSGLRIHIGRIEGSIWSRTVLRDVRLSDPDGLFAESPEINLNWRPIDYLWGRLQIHELRSNLVIVHRRPALVPSAEPQPILPDFDIHVGRLDVRQLRLGARIAGRERTASLLGEADIRSGRALVSLRGDVREGGDRLRLHLDAEPDRDRFDLEAHVSAPANGALGALIGTNRPMQLDIGGDGVWSRWAGMARLDVSGQRTADLRLTMDHGALNLAGWAAPAPYLTGKPQRLTVPRVLVNGTGTLAERRLTGRLSLRSAALRLETRGTIDLGQNRFEGVQIAADLLQPRALFPNMSGRDIRLALLLDGPFSTATAVYRATTPRIAFDQTGFEEVRAAGRTTFSPWPMRFPIQLTARRVTGVGDVAGGILANLNVQGTLLLTPERLTGDRLVLTSDKLRGLLTLALDLRTGNYAVQLTGGLRTYTIPGLGVVDVLAEARAVPGPGGRGTMITGQARAWVRRLDNAFLLSLAGGLPQLRTNFTRDTSGVIRFTNLRLAAPKLTLAGNGMRRNDGTFFFEGVGRHADYGPLRLILDGPIDRPRVTARLERPMDALGLSDVTLSLEPNAGGFAWRAEGGSMLGPFTGNGQILLPAGQPATIQVATLNVSGTRMSGALRSDPGGFTGRLDVDGGGLTGRLLFAPFNGHQRIAVNLTANDASFVGPPPIVIRRGTIEAVVLLDPAGTSIEGRIQARGVSRGPMFIASLDATASLRGGSGRVEGRIAGARGRDFALELGADVSPGRYSITGRGTLDGRPLELTSPAILVSTDEGWRLERSSFRFAGGQASLAGLFGARTELDARLQTMPLTVLDMAFPELGLGGVATGTLRYSAASGGAPPSGEANLRIRGLTRAGLVLSSRPVDIGLNARLDGVNAALRAVVVSEGQVIGRAQARLSPLGSSGGLFDRLTRAPMRAQVRYNGAADTLWRLTGVELLDLSGPVAMAADMRGTLADPVITGSVQARAARLESAVTGMVIDNLDATGRFGGSRLQIQRFTGRTEGGGTVSGAGLFDFSAERGIGMQVDINAQNARLLDRDDIRTDVTGDIAIRSDGDGGRISGAVVLNAGRFQLGSVTSAGQVPRLNVREINRLDAAPEVVRVSPWRLALDVTARRGLIVTGLGLNSEWAADLRVGGTVTEPRIRGDARLRDGTYDFAGRRFDLIRGNIRFQGESPINPQLDLAAEVREQGLNAQIRVAGYSERPDISFTSTPALPQDELLSRILFGTSITNLSAPEAIQLASAVAALNSPGGGLDPINALRRGIGLDRLRILPADVTQGIGTQIAAGKYFGRRVYVEVVTDGRGYSATSVEFQITRWLSLLGTVSTIGRQSLNLRVSRDY